MAMIVQHNMQAMNANRMLGIVSNQQAKSTEKLSSGFRINRAADDAAGLAISEKMRSHQLIPELSSYKQKFSAGTYGAIVLRPFAIQIMSGV